MVSIIIVTLGEDEILQNCLASIRKYIRVEHEIILVNNSPLPVSLPKSKDITIIENGRNLGFSRAVNKGIAAATGNMILLLNSDTEFSSDILTSMQAFMLDHPGAGICSVQLIFADGSAQNSVDLYPNIATQILNKSLLKILFPRTYPSKRSKFSSPVQVPSVIGACMLIKRQVIDTIGELDEGFFFYLEETDLCKRARDHGFEVWHLPHLRLVHHQGTTARKANIKRKIEFQRSLSRFFMKHKGFRWAAILLVLTIVKSMIEIATKLPFCFQKNVRASLKNSCGVLIWHLSGSPTDWGLADRQKSWQKHEINGYSWFLPQNSSIPDQIQNPNEFLKTFSATILNRSRTALVKSGKLGENQIYLKRYNFKGIKDTFKNLFRKSRALRALEAALMVENMGLNTPGVIFACEKRRCGILLESFIATRAVDAGNLVEYAREKGFSEAGILHLARYIRHLHERGIIHADLKGENLLMDDKDKIYLIDLDRLKRYRHLTPNKIAKNLSYLHASMLHLISDEQRRLFFNEYLKGNPSLEARKDSFFDQINIYTAKRLASRYS